MTISENWALSSHVFLGPVLQPRGMHARPLISWLLCIIIPGLLRLIGPVLRTTTHPTPPSPSTANELLESEQCRQNEADRE